MPDKLNQNEDTVIMQTFRPDIGGAPRRIKKKNGWSFTVHGTEMGYTLLETSIHNKVDEVRLSDHGLRGAQENLRADLLVRGKEDKDKEEKKKSLVGSDKLPSQCEQPKGKADQPNPTTTLSFRQGSLISGSRGSRSHPPHRKKSKKEG